jgi:hypothetical protein
MKLSEMAFSRKTLSGMTLNKMAFTNWHLSGMSQQNNTVAGQLNTQECHSAECHFSQCFYPEGRGAIKTVQSSGNNHQNW